MNSCGVRRSVSVKTARISGMRSSLGSGMMVENWHCLIAVESPWNVVVCAPGVQTSCSDSVTFIRSGLSRPAVLELR